MGRRTKIITEYRQAGRDVDGDNIVGMGTVLVGWGRDGNKMAGIGCGWRQDILPLSSSNLNFLLSRFKVKLGTGLL